jgi:hypothetical protein
VAGYLTDLQKKEHPGIIMKALIPALFITLCACLAHAAEYHVSQSIVDVMIPIILYENSKSNSIIFIAAKIFFETSMSRSNNQCHSLIDRVH